MVLVGCISIHRLTVGNPSYLAAHHHSACTGVALKEATLNFPILLPPSYTCTDLTLKFNRRIKMHLCSGFIDFIVSPTLNVCGDVISLVAGR